MAPAHIDEEFSDRLRRQYAGPVAQPIPDPLMALVEELDRRYAARFKAEPLEKQKPRQ